MRSPERPRWGFVEVDPKVLDELLAEHGHRLRDIAGEKGLLKQLTKTLLERALQAEMREHLG